MGVHDLSGHPDLNQGDLRWGFDLRGSAKPQPPPAAVLSAAPVLNLEWAAPRMPERAPKDMPERMLDSMPKNMLGRRPKKICQEKCPKIKSARAYAG